jgi:integrase
MKRSNGEGSIYRREDGLYRYTVTLGYDKNKKPIKKTFSSMKKRIAIQKGMEALTNANLGVIIRKANTFEQMAEIFLKSCKSNVEQSTLPGYRIIIKKHLVPFFKDKKIADIYQSDIQEFFDNEINVSESTLSKEHFLLRAIFEMSADNNKILKNPVKNIKMPKPKPKNEKQAYSTDEMYALLEYAEQHPKGGPVVTILLSGLRPEEMCGLMGEKVDCDTCIMKVDTAIGIADGIPYVKGTKNDASKRVLPIAQRLADYLKKLNIKNGYLFPNSKGNFNNPVIFRNSKYKTFMKNAPVRYLNPHELRHTFNTELYRRGVPEFIVKKLMGHTIKDMSTGTYFHEFNMLKKAINLLNDKESKWS